MELAREVHQVLLGCGFIYTYARHIPEETALRKLHSALGFYVKSYDTSAGTFKVALVLDDDPYTSLPSAIVLQAPEQFKGKLLPHINMGWYLCYVEEKEANWDANDLEGILRSVDGQIGLTLNNSVRAVEDGSDVNIEIEGEFSSYWLPSGTVYLLVDPSRQKELNCFITKSKTAGGCDEWVVCDEPSVYERDSWLTQRNLDLGDSPGIVTHYLRVKPSKLSGMSWPPNKLRAVLEWLSEVDTIAWLHLMEHFLEKPVKRHLILLDVFNQDMVGFFVELDLGALALRSYSSYSKRKRGKSGRINHRHLANTMSSEHASKKFHRVNVVKADRQSILKRNRRGVEPGDLSTKNIALIGCGTIGGYLAGLLLRAGAGCGEKLFHLYDDDSFKPDNFGRHVLTTSDIGKNKAEALTATLCSSTHLARNVKAFPSKFTISTEHLKRYDIVIDATGRPPVSRRLASVVRALPSVRMPILVHGFNDGNGRASKVIIDNGSCCYGCLMADDSFYKDGLDLRFKGIDMMAERHVSCGSTYTPYDAAVSIITAGLIQEATLSTLEVKSRWTYSEHLVEGGRTRKQQILLAHQRCGICHGQIRTSL